MSTETDASSVGSTAITALPHVTRPGRVPIKSWVVDIDGIALEQATNLSNLPFALSHVALMPDAHAGYGMPIGGVLFAERAVVPYAIGVDIGCGVVLVETDLTVESPRVRRAQGGPCPDRPGRPGSAWRTSRSASNAMRALAEIGLELPVSIESTWFERAVSQLGMLGSGNRFLGLR